MKNKSAMLGLYGLAMVTIMSNNMILNSTFIPRCEI